MTITLKRGMSVQTVEEIISNWLPLKTTSKSLNFSKDKIIKIFHNPCLVLACSIFKAAARHCIISNRLIKWHLDIGKDISPRYTQII